MTDASRDHKNVAASDLDAAATWAAEDKRTGPVNDAEDLVRSRVVPVERMDPVHPRGEPAVASKKLHALGRAASVGNVAVDEHR